MALATNQFTIVDLTDVNISNTAPSGAELVLDALWFDKSITPPALKRWDGSQWVSANISPADYQIFNQTASGTSNYRTTGAPTNSPTSPTVSSVTNADGSVDITVSWDTYIQGAKKADNILVMWKKGAAPLGAPTLLNNVEFTNVNTTASSSYTLSGVNPSDNYSFGIAASRRTENGVEVGSIVSPSSIQDKTFGTPNFTGLIAGTIASGFGPGSAAALAGLDVNGNVKRVILGGALPTWNPALGVSQLVYDNVKMGFVDATGWKTFIKNDGSFYFAGSDANNYITWDGTSNRLDIRGKVYAQDISAGSVTIGGATLTYIANGNATGSTIANSAITVDGTGTMQGIGTSSVVVDNTKQLYSQVVNKPQDLNNIVLKSTFEDGTKGVWDGSVVAVTGRTYTKALQVNGRDFFEANWFPVNPGEVYYVSADIDASTSTYTVTFGLHFKDSAGVDGWGGGVSSPAGSGWVSKIDGKLTVPAGCITARPWIQLNGMSGFGTARLCNLRISRFQQGATVGAPTGTLVGNTAVATIESATTNFNTRNDRLATAVVVPTILSDGTAIDHTVNTDGSVNISFEWLWSGTPADIDGFIIYMYQGTTNAAYTFGTTPAAETTLTVTNDRRAVILPGVPADKFYTLGVQAYRTVDPDINSAGVIKSVVVKPALAAENPYQPATTVAFAGDITGTIGSKAISNYDNSAIQLFTPVLDGVATSGSGIFTKTRAGTNWDSQVRSAECCVGNAQVVFQVLTPSLALMVGLNTDPDGNSSYVSLDRAWYINAGVAIVYENGYSVGGSIGGVLASDVFSIVYDNVTVRYYINGLLRLESAATAGNMLYLDSSFNNSGGQIKVLNYGPYVPTTWGAVSGTGKPDDYATVGATWGSNVTGQPNDAILLNNLIDPSTWVQGSQPFGWNLNGNTSQSQIVSGIGPKGNSALLWQCISNGASGPQGGWNTSGATNFKVDSSKTYRFAVPVCVSAGNTGNIYWGIMDGTVCTINTTTGFGNPYFATCSRSAIVAGIWYLMVGYVFPAGSTGMTHDGAGIYNMSTGLLVSGGTNYSWVAGMTYASTRAYQYYTTSATDRQLFGLPMVHCVNGAEPSLKELLSNNALLNQSIAIDGSGAIQGIGAGAGTQIKNSLLDGAIQSAATTAVWSNIPAGTGKPDDYATVGANASNLQVGVGTNLCTNSDFMGGTSDGWWQSNYLSTASLGFNMGGWYPDGGNAAYLVLGTETAGYSELQSTSMPVVAGQRYEYYAKTGAHRCYVDIFVYWYSGNGVSQGNSTLVTNTEATSGGTTLAGYQITGGFTTAPAGATYAKLVLRKGATRYGSNSYMFVTQCFFGVANVGQTQFSPWSPSLPTIKNLGYTGALDATKNTGALANLDSVGSDRIEILSLPLTFSGSGSSYTYANVVDAAWEGGITGIIKIALPSSKRWSNTMMAVAIEGYDYSGVGEWSVKVGGYNYGGLQWINTSCSFDSTPPFSIIRLADDGTTNCILLGTTSTVWSYPKIKVTKLIAGYSNITGWINVTTGTPWSISLITTEAGLSYINTPPRQDTAVWDGIREVRNAAATIALDASLQINTRLDITGPDAYISMGRTSFLLSDATTGIVMGKTTSAGTAVSALFYKDANNYMQFNNTGLTVKGNITATTGTFSGTVNAATFTGNINATNGTITGGTISGGTITAANIQTSASTLVQRCKLNGTDGTYTFWDTGRSEPTVTISASAGIVGSIAIQGPGGTSITSTAFSYSGVKYGIYGVSWSTGAAFYCSGGDAGVYGSSTYGIGVQGQGGSYGGYFTPGNKGSIFIGGATSAPSSPDVGAVYLNTTKNMLQIRDTEQFETLAAGVKGVDSLFLNSGLNLPANIIHTGKYTNAGTVTTYVYTDVDVTTPTMLMLNLKQIFIRDNSNSLFSSGVGLFKCTLSLGNRLDNVKSCLFQPILCWANPAYVSIISAAAATNSTSGTITSNTFDQGLGTITFHILNRNLTDGISQKIRLRVKYTEYSTGPLASSESWLSAINAETGSSCLWVIDSAW